MTATHSLERRALSLGTAYALDYGLQFILPVVLTRALDPHAFGEYRLLWLAMSTLLVIMPMCMPQSLYYFLPRTDERGRRLFLNQCLIFLALAGLVAAWIMSPFDPWLPVSMRGLVDHAGAVVPVFTMLWIFSWVLDVLPTVDERVHWQARAIVGLSALRAVALSGTALATHDIVAVFWVLAAFTAFKAMLLLVYVSRFHGLKRAMDGDAPPSPSRSSRRRPSRFPAGCTDCAPRATNGSRRCSSPCRSSRRSRWPP